MAEPKRLGTSLSAQSTPPPTPPHQTNQDTLTCPTCGKIFVGSISTGGLRSNFNRHLLTHKTGPRPYKCTGCDAEFTTSSNLKRHVQRRHPELLTSILESFQQRPVGRKNKQASSASGDEAIDNDNIVVGGVDDEDIGLTAIASSAIRTPATSVLFVAPPSPDAPSCASIHFPPRSPSISEYSDNNQSLDQSHSISFSLSPCCSLARSASGLTVTCSTTRTDSADEANKKNEADDDALFSGRIKTAEGREKEVQRRKGHEHVNGNESKGKENDGSVFTEKKRRSQDSHLLLLPSLFTFTDNTDDGHEKKDNKSKSNGEKGRKAFGGWGSGGALVVDFSESSGNDGDKGVGVGVNLVVEAERREEREAESHSNCDLTVCRNGHDDGVVPLLGTFAARPLFSAAILRSATNANNGLKSHTATTSAANHHHNPDNNDDTHSTITDNTTRTTIVSKGCLDFPFPAPQRASVTHRLSEGSMPPPPLSAAHSIIVNSPTSTTPSTPTTQRLTTQLLSALHACPFEGCGKQFVWKNSLTQHIHLHHREVKEEFVCDACQSVLSSMTKLRRHQREHCPFRDDCAENRVVPVKLVKVLPPASLVTFHSPSPSSLKEEDRVVTGENGRGDVSTITTAIAMEDAADASVANELLPVPMVTSQNTATTRRLAPSYHNNNNSNQVVEGCDHPQNVQNGGQESSLVTENDNSPPSAPKGTVGLGFSVGVGLGGAKRVLIRGKGKRRRQVCHNTDEEEEEEEDDHTYTNLEDADCDESEDEFHLKSKKKKRNEISGQGEREDGTRDDFEDEENDQDNFMYSSDEEDVAPDGSLALVSMRSTTAPVLTQTEKNRKRHQRAKERKKRKREQREEREAARKERKLIAKFQRDAQQQQQQQQQQQHNINATMGIRSETEEEEEGRMIVMRRTLNQQGISALVSADKKKTTAFCGESNVRERSFSSHSSSSSSSSSSAQTLASWWTARSQKATRNAKDDGGCDDARKSSKKARRVENETTEGVKSASPTSNSLKSSASSSVANSINGFNFNSGKSTQSRRKGSVAALLDLHSLGMDLVVHKANERDREEEALAVTTSRPRTDLYVPFSSPSSFSASNFPSSSDDNDNTNMAASSSPSSPLPTGDLPTLTVPLITCTESPHTIVATQTAAVTAGDHSSSLSRLFINTTVAKHLRSPASFTIRQFPNMQQPKSQVITPRSTQNDTVRRENCETNANIAGLTTTTQTQQKSQEEEEEAAAAVAVAVASTLERRALREASLLMGDEFKCPFSIYSSSFGGVHCHDLGAFDETRAEKEATAEEEEENDENCGDDEDDSSEREEPFPFFSAGGEDKDRGNGASRGLGNNPATTTTAAKPCRAKPFINRQKLLAHMRRSHPELF